MADEQLRAVAIVLVVLALTATGYVSLGAPRSVPPAPCAAPALEGDVLRCDGQGDSLGARAWLVGQKLDVNRAQLDDLTALPRVGPSMARKILDARNTRGGFRSVSELEQVKGIGPKTLARLSPLLTVSDVAPLDDEDSNAAVDGLEEPTDLATP